jgi:hypothetical protein
VSLSGSGLGPGDPVRGSKRLLMPIKVAVEFEAKPGARAELKELRLALR